MRLCQFLIIFLSLLLLGASGSAQIIADPNEPDTLRIDSASAFVTGIGVVAISFFNDEELTFVEATLEHNSDQIKVDSFSFAGGRLDADEYNKNVLISDDSSLITIFSLTVNAIPPGNGLLGRLYYSYSHTIAPQTITIDTTTWAQGPIVHTTRFSPTGSPPGSFVPQVVPGYLDIMEAPETYDSVWIDDVEAAPSDAVALNVYAFNERALSKIALALDYGSPLLIFDSVSFAGSRSEGAPSKTVQPQLSLHKLYVVINFGESVPLGPGSGPVAVLHFTVDPAATEEVITIDSTTYLLPNTDTRYTLTEIDGWSIILPFFTPGSVEVKIPTDVEDITDQDNLPVAYDLAQNYPNPFNPATNIEFSLPQSGQVSLEVFNILGRRVRRLIDRELPAGEHRLVFDGRSDRGRLLATGVYFYRLTTESFQNTKKMLLLK